jgi:hypothetical protein
MKFTILCEDAQSACFLRRFLKKRRHDIAYENIAPAGQVCWEQWVREHFPAELDVVRKSHVDIKLIVCTDADERTVPERIQGLRRECASKNVEDSKPGDPVAFTIPKRNIETWIEHFLGREVDEEQDYAPPRHRADGKKCQAAVEGLAKYYLGFRPELPPPDTRPPSLNRACAEWRRLRI